MGWTLVAVAEGTVDASGTTLDCATTLNVAINDLLVGIGTCYGGASTHAIASTVPDNQFTMLDNTTNTDVCMTLGYCVVSTADAAATFRLTNGTARAYRQIIVYQFRPDAGDTVSIDGDEAVAVGLSTASQSGDINTSETDVVIFGATATNAGTGFAGRQIGDVAADGFETSGNLATIWYRILSATVAAAHAQATHDNVRWICDVVAFKSVAEAAGGVFYSGRGIARGIGRGIGR